MESGSRILELRQIRSRRKESAAGRYARSYAQSGQIFPSGARGNFSNGELSSFKIFARRRWKVALLSVAIALFAEIFVFNIPFWSSRTTQSRTVDFSASNLSNAAPAQGGWVATAANPSVTVANPENRKIKYLHLNQSALAPKWTTYNYTAYVFFKDGSTPYSDNNEQGNVSTGLYESRYINMGGASDKVKIQFDIASGDFLPFTSVTVNPHIGFRFSILRFALMLLLCLFAIFLGPNSPLWRWKLSDWGGFEICALCANAFLIMLFYVLIFYMSSSWSVWTGSSKTGAYWGSWTSFDQYGNLANSLLHGHTWLDLPVQAPLKEMKNPYDPLSRMQVIGRNPGMKVFWDHAFYNGKYYCYFGVIPAIVFFMPFEIITGKQMESCWAILIAVLLATAFATLLLARMSKIWFPNVSFGAALLASWMLGIGGGILYHVFTASFYSVPESSSFMFSMAGLWCWFESLRRRRNGTGCRVDGWWIFFGSLFMACNLGCRPGYVFLCLLAIPIFWTAVFKERLLFSGKGLFATVMAFLPFFLVFIPLFAYNHVRFGSFFDFGNAYQLTGFDASHPAFTRMSAAKGIFYYLFQPMNLTASFPFVGLTGTPSRIFYPIEPYEGGYFAFIAPFALILFAIPWIFSRARRSEMAAQMSGGMFEGASARRSVMGFAWTAIASGFFVMCMDSYLGGLSQRYISDFGVAFALAAICCYFAMFPVPKKRLGPGSRLLALAAVTAVCLCLILEFFEAFTVGRYGSLLSYCPQHYFPVKDWFLFLS